MTELGELNPPLKLTIPFPFQNHSTKRQIRGEIITFLSQLVDHDLTWAGPLFCISSCLRSPTPTPTAAGEHEQCPASSWYGFLLKTEINQTPLFFPRPAHTATGAVQKSPAEANTPCCQGMSWHLMLSTP